MNIHFVLGCKIIMPVIGFECHLCKVFIRNENDIEDHVVSFQHLTVYEVIFTLLVVDVCS